MLICDAMAASTICYSASEAQLNATPGKIGMCAPDVAVLLATDGGDEPGTMQWDAPDVPFTAVVPQYIYCNKRLDVARVCFL